MLWGPDEIPVRHLYDEDGDETDTLARAFSFVAGPVPTGGWLSGRICDHPEIWKH